MFYPDNIELKLGFDQIRAQLTALCRSQLGVEFVNQMKFATEPATILKFVTQTDEFKRLLESGDVFPNSNFIDVRNHLEEARLEGVFLQAEPLHDIAISLETIQQCLQFIEKRKEDFPELYQLGQGIDVPKEVAEEINKAIDEKGEVRPNATPALGDITHKLHNAEVKLRKKINQELKKSIGQGFSKEDANMTIRGGRMVIPVMAEHKRKMPGFIHDESATGQIVYIEPTSVLEVNNEIRELEYEQRREIIRILTALTDGVRPFIVPLSKAYRYLGMVDFIRAKAEFAIDIEAIKPHYVKEAMLEWHQAIHPLLKLSYRTQEKEVVPLSILLDQEQRILVISGPNAGGKSVCLKTVGLLQYMFQCGMLIPVNEGSKISVFKNLLMDIGDEQSLENDLSTYSSHLTNMKFFLKNSNQHTLFLIDEFGTGTDPNFGGVIAEIILSKLNEYKAFGIVNTHYSNLKQFADRTEGIVNGAMRFDVQRLEPLYKLEIGKPGSSFALEIAYKIGLPHQLIDEVKEALGEEKVNFDKMLARIERDKLYYDKKKNEVKQAEKKLKASLSKYEDLVAKLEAEKKSLINQAREEAAGLLKDANQRIEATIKSIKENKADKEKTKAVRESLETFKKSVKPEKRKIKTQKIELEKGEITPGSYVRVKGQTTIGEVIGIKGKDVEIRIGSLTSKVKLNRLEKISKKAYKAQDRSEVSGVKYDKVSKHISFQSSIDLRGKRTEEALGEVDRFIDNALMTGAKELTILHGKGNGILREMIRKHLRSYDQVNNIHDAHADKGGAGITIFELN